MRRFFGRDSKPAVAVLDAEAPTGLAFTRSLGRAGIPVRVYSPRRYPVSRLSRYCTGFGHCPDPEDAEAFLPWLRAEVATGNISLVAPTSDLIAFYMGEFPEVFPPEQQQGMPTRDALLDMLFKDRFDAACKKHHVPCPWTSFPASVEEAMEGAEKLPYPVILKPKSHVGVGWARGVVVRNSKELHKSFLPYSAGPQRQILMDRFPELAWPMIQEYVPSALSHLYSVGGLLDQDGQVVAYAGSRKTLQWPPTLGVGVIFESWNAKGPIEMGLKFAQAVMKRGIFELELIYDPRHDHYVAIDLNPRAHGHISFDIARNNDLPLLWYRMTTGEHVPTQPPAVDNVRWLHAIPYHVGHWIGVARGPDRKRLLDSYVNNLRGHTVDIINDAHDPLPSVAHFAYMFRNPGGLIRPFLREPF